MKRLAPDRMSDLHETELVEAPAGPASVEAALESAAPTSLGAIAGAHRSAHSGPAAAGDLRPDQVIAMQRSAGNTSVSRLIASQDSAVGPSFGLEVDDGLF